MPDKPKGKPRGKPFRKGDPRAGRPRGVLNKRTVEVRDWARSIVQDPQVQALTLEQARTGQLPSSIYNELLHYAYGKPPEHIEHSGPGGGAIEHDLSSVSDESLRKIRQLLTEQS